MRQSQRSLAVSAAERRGAVAVYFIWKLGARFSVKARGPSLASSDMNTAMPILASILNGVVLVHALGVADRLQDRLHGERAVGGDHLGDLERLVQRLAVGHDVADQARSPWPRRR